MNPVHIFTSDVFKIRFNIILTFIPKFHPVCIFHISHAGYMPRPSYIPWLDLRNNIRWPHFMTSLL